MTHLFDRGAGFLVVDDLDRPIPSPESFSEEQWEFKKVARAFMDREVIPHAKALENKDLNLMRQLMLKAGEQGLLMVEIPEAYGGLGLGITTASIVGEEFSREANFSVTAVAHMGIGTLPVVFFGTHEAKSEILPKSATGEWIGAYCLTEPGSGSDAMAARTSALSTDQGWSVNGNKQFITNAGFADYFCVFAQVDPEASENGRNFTGFVAKMEDGGIEIGPEEHKMGVRGSSTCPVTFNDCGVPTDNLLGKVGKGHRIAFGVLNVGRLKLAAGAAGGIKQGLNRIIAYTSERRQFDKAISEFALTRSKIGVLVVKTYAIESALYRCSGEIDKALEELDPAAEDYGERKVKILEEFAVECAAMKIFGSEMLDEAVDEFVQLHGGYGFIEDYFAEGAYRNSRINRIWEGTNEINRMLIPGTIMRKALKGQLMEIVTAQQALMQELATGQVKLPDYEGIGADALETAARLRRLAVYVMGMAGAVHGTGMVREQESLVGCADLVILSYVVDSAGRRAHQAGDELMGKMADLYAALALDQARMIAQRQLIDLGASESLNMLEPLLRPTTTNVTNLSREIGDAAITAEGYPLKT